MQNNTPIIIKFGVRCSLNLYQMLLQNGATSKKSANANACLYL